MPTFKRLVAQVHDIEADTPAQADEIARIRADAVNAGMRVLGHGTAWAVTVLDADSEEGGLTDILQDAYLLDEIDDNPERNPHTGYIALDETVVFERLLAWRDAAVKAALDALDDEPEPDPASVQAHTECAGVFMNGIIPPGEARKRATEHYTECRDADQSGLDRIDGGEAVTYWRGQQRFYPELP